MAGRVRCWSQATLGRCGRGAVAALALTTIVGCLAGPARSGESPFGWIYTADIHPPGRFEYEHQSFLQRGQARGEYNYLQNREEIEFGVTNRLQLSAYLNWSYARAFRNGIDGTTGGPGIDLFGARDPMARYGMTRVDSVSLEAIYQILNPVTDPIGLALYVEPEFGPRTRELEWRIILQKNLFDDRLIIAANIMGAHEREQRPDGYERASVLDITLGASYRFADNWSAGIEGRVHNEFDGLLYDRAAHSAFFLGPNVHYAAKDYWVTLAWRHQMPWVRPYSQDQKDVVLGGRIYGDEHARDEVILKVGVPF
jgi:hypothetical protein